VDVTSKAPIPAFCSSDEEDEDKEALLYLPIAPEIEDPEDNWVPVRTILLLLDYSYVQNGPG
jgi:COMPASS component SWD1